jgi:hypothetical protein
MAPAFQTFTREATDARWHRAGFHVLITAIVQISSASSTSANCSAAWRNTSLGHATFGEPRGRLGEFEGGAFAGGEERRVAPDRQHVEALLGFAAGARVAAVQVDAVRAAVEL